MPFFGCSTLSQSHIEPSRSEPVAHTTPLLTQPISDTNSTALDDAFDQETSLFLETSCRSQTNQKLNVDAAPTLHPQAMTSSCNPLSSPFASPPITLIVGGPSSPSPHTPQTTFYVHADLLTSVSSFFRAAFDNHNSQAGFLEASTLTMRLPEQRPEDMAYLVQWLYDSKGIPTIQSLHHDLIDIPLQKMEAYKRERAIVQHAEKHGDVSQLISPRPNPPAFGPLIRLYILADRLSVHAGLKSAICRRVREVGNAAAAVPSKDDLWRLWDGVPKLLGRSGDGVKATGFGGAMVLGGEQGEDLKSVVLEMYANMRGWVVFEDVDVDESGEEFDWHPLFMRALVVRLLREKRKVREAARNKESKCKCNYVEAGGGCKDEANMV
jgi:hypothetical protein